MLCVVCALPVNHHLIITSSHYYCLSAHTQLIPLNHSMMYFNHVVFWRAEKSNECYETDERCLFCAFLVRFKLAGVDISTHTECISLKYSIRCEISIHFAHLFTASFNMNDDSVVTNMFCLNCRKWKIITNNRFDQLTYVAVFLPEVWNINHNMKSVTAYIQEWNRRKTLSSSRPFTGLKYAIYIWLQVFEIY